MILAPHETRCPACDRGVYAIDDLFVAHDAPELRAAAPKFVPGIYHYHCFLESPHREAVLGVFAATGRARWPADTEYLTTLARDRDFALTLRPYTGAYTLHFIPWGRFFAFADQARWQEFLVVMRPGAAEVIGDARLRPAGDGWELATRQLVPVRVEFTPADVERIRQHLTDADPTAGPVDLGMACRQLRVKPVNSSCPPERLNGTFAWPDPLGPAKPVSIEVRIECWSVVLLSAAELERLRKFLRAPRPEPRRRDR